jgi:hypothetical protein
MKTSQNTTKHWYPVSSAQQQPSDNWYFGRAIYVSRKDYLKIFYVFISIGIPLGILGLVFPGYYFMTAAFTLAGIGLSILFYSLFGLYRQYGPPAMTYFKTLLGMENVQGRITLADIHIGTYRHSYKLAEALPEATIHSVDYWGDAWPVPELAIQDVRDLEFAPAAHPRIHPQRCGQGTIALADESCDVVVLGFGTHEINAEGAREKLFSEVQRILKPGGKVLMFEHGYDLHNFIIFGPVIHHVTTLAEWKRWMNLYFTNMKFASTSSAVNLLSATKK